MRVKNKKRAASLNWRSPASVNALKAYMGGLGSNDKNQSFDDIRASVPELKDMPDGHIHQLAIDGGLEVEA